MSLIAEAPGFIKVFSDGSVKRFAPCIAPPSNDPVNGYRSKDLMIDPSKPITARIFHPTPPPPHLQLLPVIVYFHGGGFSIGSTTWLGCHVFLGDLSVASKSIVLSVDYRLAPEHKLPIAYEDCYSALDWLSHQLNSERWLEKADLSRVFISGDSAGGNIAHQVAVKALKNRDSGVRIKGLMPIHPYFGSKKRTELELEYGSAGDVAMNDMFWSLSLPEGANRDYYGCNIEKSEDAEWHLFPAVEVYVAGLDFLKERGVAYAEFLKARGVRRVKLVEAQGETHVYHVFDPQSPATRLLQKQMSEFIHSL